MQNAGFAQGSDQDPVGILRIISPIRLTGIFPQKTLNRTRESPQEKRRKTWLLWESYSCSS